MHVCCFSTSLEDLPVRDKRDPVKVFDTIAANGRFSSFEIDDHLAGQVTWLFEKGYLEIDPESQYPWTKAKATPRGWLWRHGHPTTEGDVK